MKNTNAKDYLNTKELAEYLDINEKKIYSLIVQKRLPATKITGKWLFPRRFVDSWIENSVENIPDLIKTMPDVLMIAGSNDPVLECIVTNSRGYKKDFITYFSHTGSLNGIKMLQQNKAHICCSHLLADTYNTGQEEYNLPFLHTLHRGLKIIIINYAYREQGLIIKKENPYNIKSINDLVFPTIKYINRQQGSGTRLLFDRSLETLQISKEQINSYNREVNTHFEVGYCILNGEADAGMGIKAIANRLNLGFIPVKKERFDLIIKKENYFLKEVQLLLNMIRSGIDIRRDADRNTGYDFRDSGRIIYSS